MPDKPEILTRTIDLTRESIVDSDSRLVRLSFSSEEPVTRQSFFNDPWIEVLGHEKNEVDMERLNNSAPLLYNHDRRNAQSRIGVVERAWIEDSRGYAEVRLSKRAEVEGIWQDVRDGILRNVSVAYRINERKLQEEHKDKPNLYRVVSWTPMEISLVDIPADPTVGVGRSLEEQSSPQPQPNLDEENDTMPQAVKEAVERKRQHTTSAERVKKHRSKKKQDVTAGNTKKRAVTTRNAVKRKKGKISPDTDTEADTDTEENKIADADAKIKSDKKPSEREEKEEREKEKQLGCGKEPEPDENQILQQMADIWNEEVQSKITPDQNAILTAKRKELLKARWVDEFVEDIRAWRYFCEIIGKSDFCLGKLEGKDWTIDLTWAVHSADRVAKILEGGFSGGKHPSKPPSCNLPEFADSWDEVIRRMEYHHGKAAIRSWFTGTVIMAANDTPGGVMLTLECPSAFIRSWITDHFLTDLCLCWDGAATARPVVGMQLVTKGGES